MERRRLLPKRKIQLPTRFRDELPQPPAPLSLSSSRPSAEASAGNPIQPSEPWSVADQTTANSHRTLTTLPNAFGIFRRHTVVAMDTYDPDENLSLSDMSNIPVTSPVDPPELTLYPFPNRSSFRLADWHWNGGVQKSLGSFHDLVALVTDPEFRTEDIKIANWSFIHSELGTDDDQADWLDEDAGWTHISVTISVPYQSR